MTAAALELDDVTFRYPGSSGAAAAPALDGVTLRVEPGEVLAVVGPSGSGKSTLLRLVSGLADPTSGAIRIGGESVAGTPPERRPVAMVFQGFALFPHLTVRENIAFGLRVRKEPLDRVATAAAALGIDGLLDRLPSHLSGGERQRTALARALVRDPLVFLLDEPLSSLDPVLRTESRRLLSDLLRRDGRAALYVTHDQAEAMTIGDRVAVLRDGRLEQVGTAREVYDTPATPFVATFIGTPPASVVTVAGRQCAVRAEHVTVLDGGEDAVVVGVEDVGHEAHVDVRLRDGQVLTARVASASGPKVGQAVGVRIERAHEF